MRERDIASAQELAGNIRDLISNLLSSPQAGTTRTTSRNLCESAQRKKKFRHPERRREENVSYRRIPPSLSRRTFVASTRRRNVPLRPAPQNGRLALSGVSKGRFRLSLGNRDKVLRLGSAQRQGKSKSSVRLAQDDEFGKRLSQRSQVVRATHYNPGLRVASNERRAMNSSRRARKPSIHCGIVGVSVGGSVPPDTFRMNGAVVVPAALVAVISTVKVPD